MRQFESKEECVAEIKRWADDMAEGKARTYHPKPDPMTYDALPNLPEDVERYVIMEMSGHNHEWRYKWNAWWNERLHYITQSLSVIGQLVHQSIDFHAKKGVMEYGRKELKAKLQADIDRLQALVNEL
jgi:hypothetical protein